MQASTASLARGNTFTEMACQGQLHRTAVVSVVTLQIQTQTAKGRELSTLAPVRALRARTFERKGA